MSYKATLTLSVEGEDEDSARQAFVDEVGAADFDQSSIEIEEEAEEPAEPEEKPED